MKKTVTKTMKRYFVLLLTTALTLSNGSIMVSAASKKNTYGEIKTETINYEVMNNNNVVERVTLYENASYIILQKTISPDGAVKVDIKNESNGYSETSYGSGADYELFLKLANNEVTIRKDGVHKDKGISTRGNEVTGKNYKHVKLGTSSTTMTAKQLKKSLTTAGFAAAIYQKLNGPYASVVGLAGMVVKFVNEMANFPNKVVVSSTSYEVQFTYGGYYCHCYHQTGKIYKTASSVTKTFTDYYQAIGG